MAEKSDKVALYTFVSGRVQGVFFRMFVLREGNRLGICGRVRNLPDGRVEVVAEGERAKLEGLLDQLRKGPRGAVVQEVTEEWAEYVHNYDDFQIDYS